MAFENGEKSSVKELNFLSLYQNWHIPQLENPQLAHFPTGTSLSWLLPQLELFANLFFAYENFSLPIAVIPFILFFLILFDIADFRKVPFI